MEREVYTNKPSLEFLWCDVILRTLHGYGTVKQCDNPTKTKWVLGTTVVVTVGRTVSVTTWCTRLLVNRLSFLLTSHRGFLLRTRDRCVRGVVCRISCVSESGAQTLVSVPVIRDTLPSCAKVSWRITWDVRFGTSVLFGTSVYPPAHTRAWCDQRKFHCTIFTSFSDHRVCGTCPGPSLDEAC